MTIEEIKALVSKMTSGDTAHESLSRFIHQHFRTKGERPRASIPARPDYDDDLILGDFIRNADKLRNHAEWLSELVVEARRIFEMPEYEIGHDWERVRFEATTEWIDKLERGPRGET